VVFVTADPARDTPSVLRAWLDRFDGQFIGLTGDAATIEAAQRLARVPAASKIVLANRGYQLASSFVSLHQGQSGPCDLSRWRDTT
jgi:cytochrome oxidase Cu insertion factor (SCO1/SenC/PrrC family)